MRFTDGKKALTARSLYKQVKVHDEDGGTKNTSGRV